MPAKDEFSQSLASALKATLHVLEQVKSLKHIIDNELPAMFNGLLTIGPPVSEEWAEDAGCFVCTGVSWVYPIFQRGRGRPRKLGTLLFWIRLAPPNATSESLIADVPPFIAVEVIRSGEESSDSIDGYECPTSWKENEDVSSLDDIRFTLPLLTSGKSMEDESVWWAGFAHSLGALSEPRVIRDDLLVQAVALAKLLI